MKLLLFWGPAGGTERNSSLSKSGSSEKWQWQSSVTLAKLKSNKNRLVVTLRRNAHSRAPRDVNIVKAVKVTSEWLWIKSLFFTGNFIFWNKRGFAEPGRITRSCTGALSRSWPTKNTKSGWGGEKKSGKVNSSAQEPKTKACPEKIGSPSIISIIR